MIFSRAHSRIMNKKDKILKVALELFTEFGFHGTPTSKIAKEADVANGTLFHYFKTKEDLIVEIYINIRTKLGEYISQDIEQKAQVKDKLQHLYLNYLYWALENKAESKFIQLFRFSPYVANLPKKELQVGKRFYLDAIEQGKSEGVIKLKESDFIVMLLATHAHGVHSYLLGNKFSKSRQHQVINETFELVWRMLT